MKKKIVAVLIIALVCSVSAFAAGSKKATDRHGKDFGLGLNLGYPGVGLAFRYHDDNVRVLGAAAFSYMGSAIAIDATGEYIFATVENDKHESIIDFSAGLGLGVDIPFSGSPSLAFEAGLIANYDFEKVPLSIFARILYRPTLHFGDPLTMEWFGLAGSLGITYNFNLNKK